MPRRKTPETDLQRAVAKYLTLALPFPDAWFTSIPAGWGGKVRGPGYKAGTPDMLVIHNVGHVAPFPRTVVIWLELKSPNNWLTKPQKQCRNDLVAAGCKWALVRTLNDVERALKRFGVPLRASVAGEAG